MWSDDTKFPLGLEYMYQDTISTLRPRLKLYPDQEAAKEAVQKLQEELMAMLPKEEPKEAPAAGASGLASIAETALEEEEEDDEEWSEDQRRTPDLRPKGRSQSLSLHTIPENEEDLEGQIEDTSDNENDNSEQQDGAREHTDSYSQSQVRFVLLQILRKCSKQKKNKYLSV
jgi:hypothetical protein